MASSNHYFIKDFYNDFEPLLKDAEEKIGGIEIVPEVSEETCPNCGKNLVFRQSRFGRFLACPGFPSCRYTMPILEKAGTHCPKCNGEILLKKSRKNRTYYECENNGKDCDFISWDKPLDETCPECGMKLFEVGSRIKKSICKNPECKLGVPDKTKEETEKKKTTRKKKTTKKSTKKTTAKKKTISKE